MKFKLSKIALVAEIISAFAIVLSLFFVGFQLSNNARATRSATANSSIASISTWYADLGRDEHASAIFLSAMGSPDDQTPEHWFQFVFTLHAVMLNFQNSVYLVDQGTLDKEIRDSVTDSLLAIKDQPGFLLYWDQRKSIFFPEFQGYVDGIISSEQVNSEGVYKKIMPDGTAQ